MDKKGKEKFHFVSEDEEKETKTTKKDKEVKTTKEKETEPKKEKETGPEIKSELLEEVKEEPHMSRDEVKLLLKPYFGYPVRICSLLFLVLILFMVGLVLMVKAISNSETRTVQYDESCDATYKVCIKSDDPYLRNCIDSYKGPLKNVTDLKVDYRYLAKTDPKAQFNLTYTIVAVSRVYDKFDSSRVLYESEETLVPKKKMEFKNGKIDIDESFLVDITKYNQEVLDYQKKYIYSSTAVLEISSYIDDGYNRYITGTLNVPLATDNLSVYKNFYSNKTHDIDVEVKEWTSEETIEMFIGILLMFISLVSLFVLTKLVSKSITKKSKYETKLEDILSVYDNIIEVKEDYVIDNTKEKVKLERFEELLDTRKQLDKKIIYNRINNIKSEFIVEDYEKIYVYVLKEADVEE